MVAFRKIATELAICSLYHYLIVFFSLLAGVPGGFSRGSPVFAHLLIDSSHMS